MGHACLGKYKDPKNCDHCIDLKKCMELSTAPSVKTEAKKVDGRRKPKVKPEAVKEEVDIDSFLDGVK